VCQQLKLNTCRLLYGLEILELLVCQIPILHNVFCMNIEFQLLKCAFNCCSTCVQQLNASWTWRWSWTQVEDGHLLKTGTYWRWALIEDGHLEFNNTWMQVIFDHLSQLKNGIVIWVPGLCACLHVCVCACLYVCVCAFTLLWQFLHYFLRHLVLRDRPCVWCDYKYTHSTRDPCKRFIKSVSVCIFQHKM